MSDLGRRGRAAARSITSQLRAQRYARRPGRIASGVGAGLRFDPGGAEIGYLRGDSELSVQHVIANHLVPGSVFYDIGANVGFFTVLGARLVGTGGFVAALEPVPSAAALARRNCLLNGFTNVQVIERAASNVNGSGALVLARHIGGAALSIVPRSEDATSEIEVRTTTVDSLVAGSALVAPTLVKIDVEGAEAEVLDGMAETITRHRPTIVCEIDDATREAFDAKYAACSERLRLLGYRVDDVPDAYPGSAWHVGHFLATPADPPG